MDAYEKSSEGKNSNKSHTIHEKSICLGERAIRSVGLSSHDQNNNDKETCFIVPHRRMTATTDKYELSKIDEKDRMEYTNESTIISASPVLPCENSAGGSTDEGSQYDEVFCHGNHTHDCNDNKRRKMDEIDVSLKETTRLKDIIGHAKAKLRIEEIILPLGLPHEVSSSVLRGIRSMPASILMYGPPGCGKTQLAKAIAGEANAAFVTITAGDVLSKFIGESETAVRNTFTRAAELASKLESKCTVVFFDEIDALGQSRDIQHGDGDACSRRVLAELLVQLNLIADSSRQRSTDPPIPYSSCKTDSYGGNEDAMYMPKPDNIRIFVIAATNRLQDCDEALRRRFGIQLEIGLPNSTDRKKMILRFLEGIEHTIIKEELEYISIRTENWSGSDLENLAREAAMAPVRECIRNAAKIRQRATKAQQQQGGDSTVQAKETKIHASSKLGNDTSRGYKQQQQHPMSCNDDPDSVARASLLQGFRSLRPVTVYDFDNGICSFTGQESIPYYVQPAATSVKGGNTKHEHYDTSSGEDE